MTEFEHIDNSLKISDKMIDRIEVANPGFINFYFDNNYYSSIVKVAYMK